MNKPVAIKLPHLAEIVDMGDDVALVLPRAVVEAMGLSVGDKVDVIAAADGFGLRRHDARFADAMAAADQVMEEDREILAVLAR